MDSYFSDIYGKRWPGLKRALGEQRNHVALENTFAFRQSEDSSHSSVHESISIRNDERRAACIKRSLGETSTSFTVKNVRVHSYFAASSNAAGKYPVPETDSVGIKAWYWLDLASLFPALALRVKESDVVLDVCAAPGGKSLVIAQQLFKGKLSEDSKGSLSCNELDDSRRNRLTGVLQEYLPKHFRSMKKVRITSWNGTKLREHNTYDKILVDAPCSSERHILMQQGLNSPSHHQKNISSNKPAPTPSASAAPTVDRWSPKGCKNFAKLQYSILKSALFCLKQKGHLVYSTCSIAKIENDFVIDKILEKFGHLVTVVRNAGFSDTKDQQTLRQLGCEPTKHGWIMLPDKSKFGPLYWCLLERRELQGDTNLVDAQDDATD